jgi:hypothetical protein
LSRKVPPHHNTDAEDLSDAVAFLDQWVRAVQVQRERLLVAESVNRLIDAQFLVYAAFAVRQAVGMLNRHQISGLTSTLSEFDHLHGYLTDLRNSLTHWDEYARGQGRAADSSVWFPLALSRRAGRVYLLIPPLGGRPADGVDLLALADDVCGLGTSVRAATSALFPPPVDLISE